jgi:hypothetical protein
MATPRTTREEVRRLQTRAVIVGVIYLTITSAIPVVLGQKWNTYYVVAALFLVGAPLYIWAMRRCRCINCKKPLGKAAAESLGYVKSRTASQCPHCRFPLDKQAEPT